MSSPHVAGAVALLLEARPHTSPGEVQKRLQNTARPHLWWGDPTLGLLDNVHRQGAGMLQIDDAILADAIVSPSSLALGEIESGSATRSLRISLEGLGNPSARRRNRLAMLPIKLLTRWATSPRSRPDQIRSRRHSFPASRPSSSARPL